MHYNDTDHFPPISSYLPNPQKHSLNSLISHRSEISLMTLREVSIADTTARIIPERVTRLITALVWFGLQEGRESGEKVRRRGREE